MSNILQQAVQYFFKGARTVQCCGSITQGLAKYTLFVFSLFDQTAFGDITSDDQPAGEASLAVIKGRNAQIEVKQCSSHQSRFPVG